MAYNGLFVKIRIGDSTFSVTPDTLKNEAWVYLNQSCVHCRQLRQDHAGLEHCLFDTTVFKPHHTAYSEAEIVAWCRAYLDFEARNPTYVYEEAARGLWDD